MAQEQTIWTGTPSQVLNLKTIILGILFCWLIVPACIAFWRWLVIRNNRYELTSQRLRVSLGVLNKQHHVVELYRVRDFTVDQPLLLRIFSVSNIILETSDPSSPIVVLRAVPNAKMLADLIRENVEAMRLSRGVRTLDA